MWLCIVVSDISSIFSNVGTHGYIYQDTNSISKIGKRKEQIMVSEYG